jgi:REP element-mobilizing transposase RayT
MEYHNLTKGRVSELGRAYSITMVTEKRIPHFSDFYLARFLINQMREINDSGKVESLTWVLMPDHLHWLLAIKKSNLSEVMRHFKGSTSHVIKTMINWQGAFWQRGFYDHAIREDEDLREVARYIVANPLRAGLVESITDYPHWDAKWLL